MRIELRQPFSKGFDRIASASKSRMQTEVFINRISKEQRKQQSRRQKKKQGTPKFWYNFSEELKNVEGEILFDHWYDKSSFKAKPNPWGYLCGVNDSDSMNRLLTNKILNLIP